jgi:hypothetical protein
MTAISVALPAECDHRLMAVLPAAGGWVAAAVATAGWVAAGAGGWVAAGAWVAAAGAQADTIMAIATKTIKTFQTLFFISKLLH